MADSKLTLQIECDAKGAITSIKQVTDSQKQLEDSNKKSTLSFIELNQALELAQKGFALVQGAASAALDAMDRGDAVIGVTSGFENLTQESGILADTLRDDLSEAAQGLLSDFDLMRIANEAMIKGIDPGALVEMTNAAVNLGESLGVDAAQAMQSATTALGNMNARALQGLGVSKEMILSIQNQIEATKESEKATKFQELALAALTKTSERFGQSQRTAGDALTTLKNAQQNVIDSFTKGFSGAKELTTAIDKLAGAVNNGKSSWEKLGEILGNVAGGAINTVIEATKDVQQSIDEWANESLKGLIDRLNEVEEGLGDAYKAITTLTTASDGVEFQALSDAMAIFAKDAQEAGVSGRLLTQVLDGLGRQLAAVSKNLDKAPGPADLSVNGPGGAGGWWEQIENGFGEALSGAGDLVAGGAEAAGGWAAVAKKISDSLQQAIVIGIEQGTKKGFEAFGGSIGAELGPLGQYLGENFGAQVYEGIEHVFGIGGTNNAAHKARNSINQFFSDILEDNTINIMSDGILQRLEEIPFDESALRAGGWADALNSASTTVQDGFKGIGLALQEQLGISEDIAGQIGAALFDGVGGNLNDLQLIIQATGFSLEELKGSIVDAFKSGEITALDTLSALRGVEEVMQAGIPGAVGATAEAFENIKKGGVNSLDALRDLGIELQEKFPGVTLTLEDLRKELIAQGKPIEEVDALMTAFASNGVDSIQELIDIGDELAISVLGQLQSSTTAFGEALSKTAEDIKTLADNLNELDGKSVDIGVNYHVNVSGDDVPSGAPGVSG